jgi:hypothetical protein
MIFIKKLLDLRVGLSDPSNNLYLLKKISLRVLYRFYQKHANDRLTSNKAFAANFQSKYTRAFVETLLLQIMGDGENNKLAQKRYF